ncbi:hypothetical protein EST38_g2942 [Candolleomyces aberdarensis]|uniref:Tricalbin n=1 Tax=Candolleomyces aberdarensis TaxID=2316362 RepID=A0A4Q2DTA6_9AGAR|nr:hypothetical protein EST38_g2942 [Candolleomyces aberdarensis]
MATLPASDAAHAMAHDILKQDADKGGVPVHSFDPDATPAQKAAQAGKAKDKLESTIQEKAPPPTEREVDIHSGPANGNVIPTITIQDHDGEKEAVAKDTPQDTNEVVESTPSETDSIPGAMPAAPYTIPDWYVIGWREHAGVDKPALEGEEKDRYILDQFLTEQFYGAWYHNAAVIIGAVFASHFLTRFGFGWGWLFIILAFCNSYYSSSMARFRRNARDDIQRELVKVRLGSEHESAEWINQFLQRFWIIYEPILSKAIVASVDQVLSIYTPAFLDSLRLGDFTLGSKAPRINQVRTFTNTDDETVMMDWAFSFTPKDTSDMLGRQIEGQANPKIILYIRVGKGLANVSMPILVEDITFSGMMRVRLKLVTNFPHIQTVDLSFLEPPTIDYVLKPIGGETFGFDIASIPGLSSFIRDTTHAVLRPMMYDPNVFTLNLEQLLSGKPLDAAIGVLKVTVHSARGVKGVKIGGGTPDPFVALSLNERAEIARTRWKSNTYNPTWVETKYILINNLHERLILNLYDYNEHRSHSKLSSASFDLAKLEEDSVQEGIVSQLLKDGKERGELRYDLEYFPAIEPEQGKDMPDSSVGIVRLVVHQAKDLDNTKSMSGELNPMAKVYLSTERKPSYTTRKYKHTNNPVWEEPYEFLCSNKESEVITVKVIDDRDFLKDPVVGYMSIRLADLLQEKAAGKDWFPLSACKKGRIRVSAEWKPVAMAGSLEGADHYTPPIGVVRLWLKRAEDVKNVEAALGGKSDPYVRVQVRNVTKGRTEVINNNLNPVWDQIIYIPVHSARESLMLECMDYQHLTKDRSLGSTELHVSDLVTETSDPRYPYESSGASDNIEPLRLDKGSTKGNLHYQAVFIPAMKLKNIKFDHTIDPLKPASGSQSGDSDGGSISDGASIASDEHFTPVELTVKPTKKRKPPPIKTSSNGTVDENGVKSVDFADQGEEGQEVEVPAQASNPTTPVTASTTNGLPPVSEGIEMTTEELLAQQSGIIVFNVISGHLAKKGRIEVLLDDGYWPCFSTPKSRSTTAQWDYVGEGFLKELDFGQVWLRLDQAEDDDKDDIAAEWVGDAREFLQWTLEGPHEFTLNNKDGEGTTTVKIESRFIPVPVTLEARESVSNQGVIRVELLDAHDLRAADRSGKSDPYAVFSLNGSKVYKSETKKKTLVPEWNETFEATVPSRVAASFEVEIFDWNQIEQAKSLGVGAINLADLEPFQVSEQNVALSTSKHGPKGHVRVRIVFQPAIIAKTRKNTSTLTTTGRALTQIGGLPVNAGKGVYHGVTGVFKRGNKNKGEGLSALPEPTLPAVPAVPTGQASKPVGAPNEELAPGIAPFPSEENGVLPVTSSNEPGTLRVTVLDAKDLATADWKPYATLRLGDREFKTKHTGKTSTPEWNESFKFAASAHTPKLFIWMHDHKTLGKDKEIGEAEIDLWRHIQSSGGVSSAEVLAQLRPAGSIRLRLEFDPATNPISSRASVSSGEHGLGRTVSNLTPSRFSIHRKRTSAEDE